MQRTKKFSDRVKEHANRGQEQQKEYDGNTEQMISTGSTLLDLAISGGRARGGGIPAGIFVEIFGPASSGKTVMLSEIAGGVQRQGGQILFRDPEARLNKQFAAMFGLNIENMDYEQPSTISEVFDPIRKWEPKPADKIHGIFADSLTALTTEWELNDKDQYGMRRAKEFSEQLRKCCGVIAKKNFIIVCSNQIRQNLDAGPYGQKYRSPGGEAIGFYSSLRLRCIGPAKIKRTVKIASKEIKKVIGVQTEIEVFKSSIWKPYYTAPLYILFDYGIDDIRANLKYIKEITGAKTYQVEDEDYRALDNACEAVEKYGCEKNIQENVIDLWEEIEAKFKQKRKPKQWQN